MKEIILAYLKIAKENGKDISEEMLKEAVKKSREEDKVYYNKIKDKLNNNPSNVFFNSTILPDNSLESSILEEKIMELLFEYLKIKM